MRGMIWELAIGKVRNALKGTCREMRKKVFPEHICDVCVLVLARIPRDSDTGCASHCCGMCCR